MYAVALRRISSSPLYAAGLAVFGTTVLAATLMDGLHLYGALVVMAILVAVSAAYPERMLIMVIAVSMLVPVDFALRIDPLPRIGPTRLLLAAFLAGLLLRSLAGGLSGTATREMPLRTWVGLFLATAAISTIFSVEHLKSTYTLISLCTEQFLLFYIAYHFVQRPGFWGRFKTTVYFVTVAICLLAFYEELTHNSIMLRVYPQEYLDFRGGILRVRSTFFHPIALACCLNMVYPYAVSDFMKQEDALKKLLLGALIALIITTLLLTVSRGPTIALIIESFLMLAWWCRRDLLKKAALTATAGLLLAGLMFALANDASFVRALRPFVNPSGISLGRISEDSSEYYRIAFAKAVISNMGGERLIYGSGPGTFFLADVESSYAGHRHVLTAPDSSVFKLLFEYGILGSTAFGILLLAVLATCLKAMRNAKLTEDPTAYACTAAVVGFLWSNLTVSMFTLLPHAMLFWASVAMASSLARPHPGQQMPVTEGPVLNERLRHTGDAR